MALIVVTGPQASTKPVLKLCDGPDQVLPAKFVAPRRLKNASRRRDLLPPERYDKGLGNFA
jgi:hypothetical protein